MALADDDGVTPADPTPTLDDSTDQAVFRWYLDCISDREIAGWIMMPSRPQHRCGILVRDGERIIAQTAASNFRTDLAQAGIGDGCCGFILPTPKVLLDGEEHVLDLIEEETGFVLTAEPIRWRYELPTGVAALSGAMTTVRRTDGSCGESRGVPASGVLAHSLRGHVRAGPGRREAVE